VLRANPSPPTQELFASAVEAYVAGYPDHETFYEGAFRLGELEQSRRRFLEAANAYARVKGPAIFEIRAAAGEVESLADALLNAEPGASDEWATALRTRAVQAFARFEALVRGKGSELDDLRGRTTLAKALAETAGPAPRFNDGLVTLDQFERRYPALQDLWPMAAALRLLAQTMLGRLDDAEKSASVLLASDDPRAVVLSDRIAQLLLRNAVDTAGHDAAASDRWMALAVAAFDRMRAAGRPVPPEARATLAQFYADPGRLEEAATLYGELLADQPQSKTVLRSAAMLANRRQANADAADYWARLARLQEVASAGWYDARLELGQSLTSAGQVAQACSSLREADGFRPDLRDAAIKARFATLIEKTCNQP
jgi:TolA-binding protein